ncbi:hypothetical protein IQB76_05850 [Leptospira borgpetersenii serovar Hardjo-bovis]|nr:hypothetical protein [Leptospira borgpetersenii serovar Hardjo-bovis]UOY19531.1 hypothetical protein K8O67_06565 [Leptospira borgpetersenii]UOZ29148.1 hypothetical protein K8O66_06610 [Leptospira borgpetersenii serovar Hardjo]MBE8360669.1 hypothetical protein [Leptospira borgpetersenii serovar Hardjo-bovis]MBE8370250.1 hypothetical protein [Leptospira borgpetersenii serovar Hardjo-bovis]
MEIGRIDLIKFRFYIPTKQLLVLMILQFYYFLDLNLIRNRGSNVQ